MEKTKAKKKLHVPKGLVEGLRLEHVLAPLGRTADVTLTMIGPPMGLAVAKKRKNDVRRDLNGKRIATMKGLFSDQSCSRTLVMFNSRAFDDRFPFSTLKKNKKRVRCTYKKKEAGGGEFVWPL